MLNLYPKWFNTQFIFKWFDPNPYLKYDLQYLILALINLFKMSLYLYFDYIINEFIQNLIIQ